MKIPRIQNSVPQVVFLLSVDDAALSQLGTQISPTRSVHKVRLDGTPRSHNPKVGDSNPPPATKSSVRRPGRVRTGPSGASQRYPTGTRDRHLSPTGRSAYDADGTTPMDQP
jgi:hypothetical protein